MARSFVITMLFAAVAVLGACDCGGEKAPEDEDPGEGSGAAGSAEAVPGTEAPDPGEEARAAFAEALRGSRTHLDLLAMAHLADVDVGGIYVDFGTPARMKHTMGRWRNEWGRDGREGDRTFTRLGESARVWIHLDRVEPLTARLHLRRVGADQLVVYLNGETLRTLELQEGAQSYDVPVPAEHLRRGENLFQLRGTGTRVVDGQPVSVELDSLWLRRGEAGEASEALNEPRWESLVREAEVDGESRRSLSVDPGTSLRFYAEVPADGTLAFGLGCGDEGATATVTVTPFDGEPEEVFAEPVTTAFRDHLVPLETYAGKVVRLELSTTGDAEAEVLWSAPQVLVPLPEETTRPAAARNVVVLTIDTLRASKVRPYNRRSRVQTPVLDAFAGEASLFENAQSPENWTKPAVASILTSLHPMTHNTKADASSLPASALMVSEVYQRAGFQTATFLANGYVSDRFGFGRGWDHYTNYIRETRNTGAENVFREAAAWIEAHREERFFVYIQTIDPHVPYDPPDEFLRMYDADHESYRGQVRNRNTANLLGNAKRNPPRITFTDADKQRLRDLHDGEISYHDRHFGTFLTRLRELGLYDDMVFVVTSDHGEEFEEHGSWGHGHSVFQELLHVPLIMRWPASGGTGLRIAPTVSTLDIAPTVLEATGVPIPEEFEGRSLLGYLEGHARPGPAVAFSDFLDDRRVIRAGRHKLILRGNLTWTMFDLEEDPRELRELDRRSANPIALRYLRILLGQYLGAENLRDWLQPSGAEPARVLPQQDSQIDAELCRQLQQLGYMDARCDAL